MTLRCATLAVDSNSGQRFVTYAVDGADLEALAMVTLENGVLRLDEN